MATNPDKTLRCLALAVVDEPGTEKAARATSKEADGAIALESKMTFIGVAGMIDPPREEVTKGNALGSSWANSSKFSH